MKENPCFVFVTNVHQPGRCHKPNLQHKEFKVAKPKQEAFSKRLFILEATRTPD